MNALKSLVRIAGIAAVAGSSVAAAQDRPKPGTDAANLEQQDRRNQTELEASLETLHEIARQQEVAEQERARREARSGAPAAPAAARQATPPAANPPAATPTAPPDATPARGTPAPAAAPPVTFDKIAPPPAYDPVVRRKPVVASASLDSALVIAPPQNDPANPGKLLDKKSPLARTYHGRGGVVVSTSTFWLSSDELDWRVPVENAGDGLSIAGSRPNAASPGRKVDPVSPGAGDDDAPPFEWAEARGRAKVRRLVDGEVQQGFGGLIRYDSKSGDILLTGFPEVIRGNERIVGKEKDSEIILSSDKSKQPRVVNCTTQLLDRDTKRKPATSPVPPAAPPPASPETAPPAGARGSVTQSR